MRLFGLEITRTKQDKALSQPAGSRGGWLPIIRESFSGAFQQNVEINNDTVLTYFAVFSCMTLIAGDIAKLRMRLMRQDASGIWTETRDNDVSPLLDKPNPFQTRIQYWENYYLSKLSNGNVYVLKDRDNRGIVRRLYILDPQRVQPLVSPSGDVFYRLGTDDISGIEDEITVPASEIIHDRFNCLYHPLIGLSPIMSAGLTAMQGHNIQQDAATFFQNRGIPGGILTAPGAIGDDTAQRLKAHWDENYSGEGAGKIAVLGDGLTFEAMRVTATDAQMIEQLKWTAEVVCSVFHVPPYKIGIGQTPSYDNVQALNTEYYSQALQVQMESAELLIDEGLEVPSGMGVEFDLDGLLRMDSAAQMDVLEKSKGKLTPNEQRKRLNKPPVEGGDTVYMQEQDHSLEWLARRDAQPVAPDNAADDSVIEMEFDAGLNRGARDYAAR